MKILMALVFAVLPLVASADDVMVLPADTHVVGCTILGSETYAVRQWNVYGSGEKAMQKLTQKYVDHAKEIGANVVLLTIQRSSRFGGEEIRPGVFMKCPLPIKTEDPHIRISQE